MFKNNQ